MSRQKKTRDEVWMLKAWAISLIFMICLLGLLKSCAVGARELPELVSVADLGPEYDGKRVAIFAFVRGLASGRGRRGSQFMITKIGKGDAEILVFSVFRVLPNLLNQPVILHGIYYSTGSFGGFPQDGPFIVADLILKDWS